MRKLLAAVAVTFCFALLSNNSLAQSKPYTPEKGSPERKAILDAVRKFRKAQ